MTTRSENPNTAVNALHMEDARTLKLALAVLIGEPLDEGRNPTLDAIQEVETLNEPFPETVDKLSRLEIGGKRLVKVERSDPECEKTIAFEPLMKEEDIPGGGQAVFLALCRRLHELVGMPKQPEDPPKSEPDLQPEAIRRLAATIRIVPHDTPVH